MQGATREDGWNKRRLGLACVILAGAAALRLAALPRRWLWYDELLSANFSAHGLGETLLNVLRFDVHPPLYYLQLSVWMMLGKSDAWLMANSVFWSLVAIGLLLVLAGRRYGAVVGLWAAALLALSPAALAYADQVRMYPFIAALMVLAWDALEKWLAEDRPSTALLLVATQLAVAYSHAVGVLMLSGCVLMAGLRLLSRRDFPRLWRWIALEALVLALSVPAMLIGAVHEVSHTAVPHPSALAATWVFLSTGAPHLGVAHLAPAIVFLGALIALAWTTPSLRLDLVALVAGPLLVAAVISYVLKPVWLDRIFVPMIPLMALVLARGITAPRAVRARTIAGAALIGAWLLIALADPTWRPKGDGYRPAAQQLRAAMKPGDLLATRDQLGFWALMWYFEGPDWGTPLGDHINNPRWAALVRKLPAPLEAPLGSQRQIHVTRGAQARLLAPDEPLPQTAGTLYLTAGVAADLPAQAPGRSLAGQTHAPPVTLQRWTGTPSPGP